MNVFINATLGMLEVNDNQRDARMLFKPGDVRVAYYRGESVVSFITTGSNTEVLRAVITELYKDEGNTTFYTDAEDIETTLINYLL